MTEESSGDKKIHDLTEVLDERSAQDRRGAQGKTASQMIVIDGREYERLGADFSDVHDLTEIIEERTAQQIPEVDIGRAEQIIERVAREIIPEIAERIIREEIEKIKNPPQGREVKRDYQP